MIQPFVDSYMKNKDKLREVFRKGHPDNYADVMRCVIEILDADDDYREPNPYDIVELGAGEYQGTLLFLIKNYSDFCWYVKVSYGSCSGCDTLQRIKYNEAPCDEGGENDYDKVSERQVDAYMTLALHVVQKMKKFDELETV